MENSTATLNIEADAWGALCNGGYIKFYDGTIPASPQTAIGSQNLLCTVTFDNPAYPTSASNGSISLDAIIEAVVTADGTTTWAREFQLDDTTVICDATVATTSADIIVDDDVLVTGNTLKVQTLNYTRPAT
ncbi:MAG: hypothetical protein KZQ83_14975 [gamma proteobacterium symbiont of Taylorina sp.]|nr:hypothetical protein [gamma proteobacterium symbiont of Taylorina sp.]